MEFVKSQGDMFWATKQTNATPYISNHAENDTSNNGEFWYITASNNASPNSGTSLEANKWDPGD